MKIKSTTPAMVQIDMMPMIDIVFQLIAFFMVITNFEQTQADERVKLPQNSLAKPAEVKNENELVLNVGYVRNLSGEKLSEPVIFYTGEEIPALKLGPVLQRERVIFESLGTEPAAVTIVIRADAEVPTGLIQEIIKLSQEAKFEKFALKATQKTE